MTLMTLMMTLMTRYAHDDDSAAANDDDDEDRDHDHGDDDDADYDDDCALMVTIMMVMMTLMMVMMVIMVMLMPMLVLTLMLMQMLLLTMMTIQQRRERMNRQINERLRTLIAAYKTLGGSFTGNLTVDPAHLRDLRKRGSGPLRTAEASLDLEAADGAERGRRIRDAVEAALSDIILLGTDEQVRLAQAQPTNWSPDVRCRRTIL